MEIFKYVLWLFKFYLCLEFRECNIYSYDILFFLINNKLVLYIIYVIVKFNFLFQYIIWFEDKYLNIDKIEYCYLN